MSKIIFFLTQNRHFAPDSLRYIVFHGRCRASDGKSLASADLVFTTYAIIVADQESLGVLNDLNWFRIALDEGMSPHLRFQLYNYSAFYSLVNSKADVEFKHTSSKIRAQNNFAPYRVSLQDVDGA